MSRTRLLTVRLTEEEWEWLRRKAHWDGVSISEVIRSCIRALIQDEGYLRPPDDEPEDFGFEKEMMEFVSSVSRA